MKSALTADVLVLNRSWLPINIITVFEAICKVYREKAQIVDHDYAVYDFDRWVENWQDAKKHAQLNASNSLSCVRFRMAIPEVIVLSEYNGFVRKRAKLCRNAIFTRDDYTCQYCGKRMSPKNLNIDHVLPRSRGGRTTWTNLALSCVPCNNSKGSRTPEEANMVLLRPPFEPHWVQVKQKIPFSSMPKSWEEFLGKMYWNAELDEN